MDYFISFSYKNGFGNAILTMKKPIKDMNGIRESQKYIEEKQNIENVIILNFKLMGE